MSNYSSLEWVGMLGDGPVAMVVAHPDDETLWCFSVLKEMPCHRELVVFCVTYTEHSLRGQELTELAGVLGFQVLFGGVDDAGYGIPLCEDALSQALNSFLGSRKWSLVLTHPPHGGEKPHLHHIQVYEEVSAYCAEHFLLFGFFSNLPIAPKGGEYRLIRNRVNVEEKARFLKKFESQWVHLQKYQFCKVGEEYLFLKKSR